MTALALCSAFLANAVPGRVRAQSLQPSIPPIDSARARDAHSAMPSLTAARVSAAIKIDGKLDESAWAAAVPATDFIQTDPAEGQPATERTEIRFLFDDEALYIGARMHDSKGDVRTRMGRRDAYVDGSDFLYVMIDSHHDHLTSYQFSVNPSGVKRDELNRNGGTDGSWDAVWDLSTSIDGQGWTAELRIPFSQLRFSDAHEQNWGIQISRRIVRTQEVSVLAFTPKSERGGVARYGHLRGLEGLKRGKPIEILPYTLARADYANVNPADPFRSEREEFAGVGLDLKYRVTSSLTLDATANPDFGQVEQDPAVVNLSAFETSFSEKRPFFVEGSDIFSFGENARLFYSRRIGRPPQGSMPDDTKYSNRPDGSTILGAGKLSGRTVNGWNLGFLEAITAREHADYVLNDGGRGNELVEPLTNYFVGRAKKNLRAGQTTIGFLGTAVHRKLETAALDELLRSSAYAGGFDFTHEFLNRTWSTTGYFALSHVLGSEGALLRTQLSSARYYQRPDADYVDLDSTATSLTGYVARLEVGKRAGLHWRGEANVSFTSPGYEINDAGFQTTVDRMTAGANLNYVENRPGKVFKDWRISTSPSGEWNYGREFQGGRIGTEWNGQLHNFWGGQINYQYRLSALDDRLTRGGPSGVEPDGHQLNVEVHSDNRKPLSGRLRSNNNWSDLGGWSRQISGGLSVRPADNWSFSIGPNFTRSHTTAQYLTRVEDATATATQGRRYLFAPIDQSTLSFETRLNVNFTPEISLEVYAQPFVSSGDYGLPMQLREPRKFAFDRFGSEAGTLAEDSTFYTIDPDGTGPASTFTLSKRDFNTRSLRGNAVLRWEWNPGSTIFLVWQQRRSMQHSFGSFDLHRDLRHMFGAKPENVFLIKLNYWINP
jgi:hypothetical protein